MIAVRALTGGRPASPPASAQQPHRPSSPVLPRSAASTPLWSPPNPPHSKAPAQHRHSASPSCRPRFRGRARSVSVTSRQLRRVAGLCFFSFIVLPRKSRGAGFGMLAGFDRTLRMRHIVLSHPVDSESARDFIAAHAASPHAPHAVINLLRVIVSRTVSMLHGLYNPYDAVHQNNEYAEQNSGAYPSCINLLSAQQIHGHESKQEVIDDNPDCKAPDDITIDPKDGYLQTHRH